MGVPVLPRAFRALLLVLLLSPLASAGVVRADDAAANKELRAAFERGLAHARSGQWASALAEFEACYRIAPRPSVLFNLAGAQLRTGHLLHAHANYHRIKSSKDPALTSAHRRAAEKQLKLIEERIPRLRVQIDGLGPDDRVLLDKTRLYPNELDMELWVDPGEHVLAVYRPSGAQEIKRFVLGEGHHQFLTLQLP
jgi:hypothetical protein